MTTVGKMGQEESSAFHHGIRSDAEFAPPALSRLEMGKVLNPTLATLHKWAEALGQKRDVDLSFP